MMEEKRVPLISIPGGGFSFNFFFSFYKQARSVLAV